MLGYISHKNNGTKLKESEVAKMIEILQSKIHRAVVTDANLDYEGSITIPIDLIELAGLCAYQKVLVVDINNGNRFETYVIETLKEKHICLNGACARVAAIGDRVIIMAFQYVESLPKNYEPTIIVLNENNEVI